MKETRSLVAAFLVLAAPTPLEAQPAAAPQSSRNGSSVALEVAVRSVRQALDRTSAVPGSYPAISVVIATRDQMPLTYVHGVTKAKGGRPVEADTPFYIASQTKAYVGLLAAELHDRKILSLDSTLADHWPGLKLRGGVDPAKITLGQLLSHQAPIRSDALTYRTAYVGAVPYKAYPQLLAASASAREPGFRYDNLGYLLYAAILERRTGRSWQSWLERRIFRPLNLRHTSTRSSQFRPETLAWRHRWNGKEWVMLPPKPDETMHPAGGIVTSSADLGRWLQAHLGRVARSAPPASAFRRAMMPIWNGQTKDSGFTCRGYALGWHVCPYAGHDIYLHSGMYIGVRSLIALSPDQGVGMAVSVASDSATGGLSGELVRLFLDALKKPEEGERRAEALATSYAPKPGRLAQILRDEYEEDGKKAMWGGWPWSPSPVELASYSGTYQHEIYGRVRVAIEGSELVARLGHQRFTLRPATHDLFAGTSAPMADREAFRFERSGTGEVTHVTWGEVAFSKIPRR